MSRQPNEQLGESATVILRLLFRHGELSISAISGLLGLYEDWVEERCWMLLARKMISWKPGPRRDNQTPLQLEAEGRLYLVENRRDDDHFTLQRRAELIAAAEIKAIEEQRSLLICLVDDNRFVLTATRRLLLSRGWEVETFADPIAFLQYAKTHHPRVVVLDIEMPTVSGLEVQKHLQKTYPQTRVLVLTGTDDAAVREQALAHGACGFFRKPVNADEFLAAVESAVRDWPR